MQTKTDDAFYESFIYFVGFDLKRERRLIHRRILSVFLWCFFLPLFTSVFILFLVKLKFFPAQFRIHLDWIILVLPIFYSLYILSSEVLFRIPSIFKQGGFVTALASPLRESLWRKKMLEEMERSFTMKKKEWEWVILNFKIDLNAMRDRTRYLTALAGAVFFLLIRGIDSLAESDENLSFSQMSFVGWIGSSAHDLNQFVGLALFLVLLYLSGIQTYQSLRRYLNCAELFVQQMKDR